MPRTERRRWWLYYRVGIEEPFPWLLIVVYAAPVLLVASIFASAAAL